MPDLQQQSIREDCIASLALADLPSRLIGHRIAVIGGTGFVGTWLAETIAALNDDLGSRVRLDLFGRSGTTWLAGHEHLRRDDISVGTIDVRSPFELAPDTTLVMFAAGLADPRIHVSDPYQTFQTSVNGIGHALAVASRLELIQRFVNISSGLVLGEASQSGPLAESDIGALDFTRFHNAYPEARRAAESLAGIYAGQYRIPVSTARAFTFVGPFQPLDAPWAISNFMRDALSGIDIRIHGDGLARRSYLYGSDAAVWLLKMLLNGRDGEVYNLGGQTPVSHAEVAATVASLTQPAPKLVFKSQARQSLRNHDFFPDVRHVSGALNVRQAFGIEASIERSMRWHAQRLGVARRLRNNG